MRRSAFAWLLGGFALGALGARGLELSTDSVAYVTMARSVWESGTLASWSGEAQGWWPPGYALLLTPLKLPLGTVPLRLALLHGLAWAITLGLVVVAARRRSLGVALTLSGGFFFSMVSVEVFPRALSEASFLPLLAGFFVALERWQQRPGTGRLLAVTILLALLPLTRTVGLAAWPVFVVAAWWHRGTVGLRAAAGAATAALLPLVGWMIRNERLFGEFLPRFPGTPWPVVDTLRGTSEVALRWWIPQFDSADALRISALLVAVALILLTRPTGCSRSRWCLELARRAALSPAFQFSVLFLALHLYGSATRLVDRPDDRVLAPLFLAGIFLVVEITGARVPWPRAGTALLAVWALYSVAMGVARWRQPPVDSLLQRSLRAESAMADSIRASVEAYADADPVVTNIPARVHWHTGRWASWDALRLPAPDLSGVDEILHLEGTGRDYLVDRAGLREAGWQVEAPESAPLLLKRQLDTDR